jgi:hypothetical protein
LRQAPWWGVAIVLTSAVLVGLFLPLMGATLAGFLFVDLIVSAVSRRRTTTNNPHPKTIGDGR